MSKKSAYLLYGYFGAGNFGDDILLYSAIQNITNKDPDARFIVRSYSSLDFLLKEFGNRIQIADFENIHLSSENSAIKFIRLMRAYWKCAGRISTLVVGGGTLIHDTPYLKSTILLTCLAAIVRLRNKNVIGIGLGTKRIKTKAGKLVVAILLRQFNKIYLRDNQSFYQCQKLHPNGNIALSSDLAYAIAWENQKTTPTLEGKIILLTLVDYIFLSLPAGHKESLINDIVTALFPYVVRGYKIRLLPMQRKNEEVRASGDIDILTSVHKKIESISPASSEIKEIMPTSDSINTAYDGVSLVIGMRFHSLIFSAVKHIPFVGIAHEPKIDALCKEFRMPCIPLDGLTTENLKNAINAGLSLEINAKDIDSHIQKSKTNFDEFKKTGAI